MKKLVASLLAPVTLLEWGGVLLYFYLSGRLSSFLHPSFRPQVLIAGSIFVLCGIVLFLTRNQKAVCECGIVENCPEQNRSPLMSRWIFPAMLLLPLGLAAIFTTDSYGSNILQTRGIIENAAALPGLADKFAKNPPPAPVSVAQPLASATEPALPQQSGNVAPAVAAPSDDSAVQDFFKPDAQGNIEVNVADLLYAAEEPGLRTPFSGKSAQIVGQFMQTRNNNPASNRFKLVRLFMTCCAADAQPISVLVEQSAGQTLPENVKDLVWTKVTGEISFPMENGRTLPVLRARTIERCEPPEEAMLY